MAEVFVYQRFKAMLEVRCNRTYNGCPSSAPFQVADPMPHHFRTVFCVTAILIAVQAGVADERPSVSFRNEVMAVLSKSGCNMGTCHGNANGKGGLKLSLRGQDPSDDYNTLTRESGSRRVSMLAPELSLLLQKPLMQIPHEGGRRFDDGSRAYEILRNWIASGLTRDSDSAATLTSLKVTPSQKTVESPENSVQLKAVATFSDGTEIDVTQLAVFEPSATFVSVTADGLVTSDEPGLTNVVIRYLNQQVPVRLEFVAERSGFEFSSPAATGFIDEAVFAQLKRLKINPASVCDDTSFLRRAYLDLTGLLPPTDVAKQFVASADTDKRAELIDRLLASEEFNDFQALRWSDLLRVEPKTLDDKGVEVFYAWIRDSVAKSKPLNTFAAEILAARGSTYTVPETNFYRAIRKPDDRGEATAQLFLGIRLQCARCHNHPFDKWTQDDYYSWSNFFGRIDYEIVENKRRDKNDKNEFAGEQIVKIKEKGDIKNPTTGTMAGLRFLGSEGVDVVETIDGDPGPDRLQQLAKWIEDPGNDRFATAQANRIWAQLMGRGVIDPVDDFRSTNPPSNPELLDGLTKEFVDHKFDVRHLMRVIMNSTTYQLASSADGGEEESAGDWIGCFARTEVRRLTAEQTLDGITYVIDSPIGFGGHNEGTKAVQLNSVRNGGHRYSKPEVGDRFLALFGKPNRLQSCECERANETTLAQTFEMISGEIMGKLLPKKDNRIGRSLKVGQSSEQIVFDLYWAALTRPPTNEEAQLAARHIQAQGSVRQGLEDVAWALLNSNEFLLRR